MTNLIAIASQFCPQQAVVDVQPLGNGLINDTFLVTTADSRFVLQRINRQVFPEPALISGNLQVLSQHLAQQKSPRLQLPDIISSVDKQLNFQDSHGDFWRAQSFIADTDSLETLRSLADAEQVGFALAHFHKLFSTLNPALLHDTLPGFHITPGYLQQYEQVRAQTLLSDAFCAEFIDNFAVYADGLEQGKHEGSLPLRVIHGDPKLNNFLFAKASSQIISLIDLDTVKPGLVHYDIGDCLRSCCHQEATDEFDLDIAAAILSSYLAEAGDFFSAADYQYLYPAIRLIPFELGLRFYSDYLAGNRYFKVAQPLQNLQRASSQFRLCADIMAKEAQLKTLLGQLR